MTRTLIVALAASATLGMASADLNAQGAGRGNGNGQAQAAQQRGNSQAAQQRAAQQQRQQQAQQQRARDAELERLRRERERQAQRDRDAQRRNDDWSRNTDWNRNDPWGRQQQARQGPAFCRNGQGHPVHGRRWCQDKGFGLGNERWERARVEDIIFGQPRDRRRYDNGATMNRTVLGDILGPVVLGQFEGYGRQRGGGNITGNWLTGVDGRVLQLSIGGVPFAQLVDSRGRGRVDSVLLRR